MSEDPDTSRTSADTDQAEHDGNEGIELTTGEPNTFEPEEDPEAAGG